MSKTKKQEQPTEKIIVITASLSDDKTLTIKIDHSGFSNQEIVGVLEQVKFSVLSEMSNP
jgi:hypothetical protein